MSPVAGYLIDTNVLLRLARAADPQHDLVQAAINELDRQDADFFFTLQNIAEFWNVCTRPAARNGFGLSAEATAFEVQSIEKIMTFLPDSAQVYSIWRHLVVDKRVLGIQVHDAHLAAAMLAYGVAHILTLNGPDFLRYEGVTAVHPSAVLSQER
jgi:predicted nucleic acid-binding protein